MAHDPHRKVCLVCGRVLDHMGPLYFHGLAIANEPDVRNHTAIPVYDYEVPPGFVRARCDFCFADDPPFILPARSFVIKQQASSLRAHGYQETGSDGNWAVCGNCGQLIAKNNWTGLVERARTSYDARHDVRMDEATLMYIRQLYRQLRKNITGSLQLDPDYSQRERSTEEEE